MTPDLIGLIRALSEGSVRYIIVGGVAAAVHGALRPTLDLDVVYARDRDNVARLAALAPCRPYLRGAPAGLPFVLDEQTILRGLNFTLVTTLGDLDRDCPSFSVKRRDNEARTIDYSSPADVR